MLSIVNRISKISMPRWVVFNVDVLLTICSMAISVTIVNSLENLPVGAFNSVLPFIVLLLMRVMMYLGLRTFESILKYTNVRDAVRIFSAIILSSFAMWVVEYIFRFFNNNQPLISYGFIILDSFVVLTLLSAFRLLVKYVYQDFILNRNIGVRNLVIYGAGEAGLLAKQTIDRDENSGVRVVAFIDDDKNLNNKRIDNIKIHHINEKLETLFIKLNVNELLISSQKIRISRKKYVVDISLKLGITVKKIPSIDSWINGEFSLNQIKNIKIEDLLERDEITLEINEISQSLQSKCILVTGAAGSIGREIVIQILRFQPSKVVLLDQSESPLFEMQLQLKDENIEIVVADICNEKRMKRVFEAFRPDYVFHAAAYKHVPLMEDNPYEAINTNIFGTRIIANLAVEHNVKKFVFISTDKAVNPTNIMGATKRVSEVYVQSLNAKLALKNDKHTVFITTRFGNVLGSNGSVIPIFKKQIESGGPVTVTHPEITRYFMTIPEACQLVLEAGVMGNGGEIFIFDMGKSVKIIDLAKKMVSLYGYKPYVDIDIVYTGLRPGEKLKEELLGTKENTIGTYNPKIMIACVPDYNYLEINKIIDKMYLERDSLSNEKLVCIIKTLIPEYISNNSVYQKFDSND
jgi:FlaA1/EpsC-like NDP-sugar epimerase